MSDYSADNEPSTADWEKKASWYKTVIELGRKGISDKSIAARLNISPEKFTLILETYEHVQTALNLARAEFEISRAIAKDEIMNDPNASKGLKYKIIRDDLKTLENWAPATRAVKVQVENSVTELDFQELSPEEIEKIVQTNNDSEAES